jgi:CheY-like chemotaxis protein
MYDIEKSLKSAQADAHINKPFKIEELLKVVNRLLKK